MSDTFIGDHNGIPTNDSAFGYIYITLYGIQGDDILGSTSPDFIYFEGGDGNDHLTTTGGGWADFYGGSGDDYIAGGSNPEGDYVYGGAGDDIVEQSSASGTNSPDYIEGGQGIDALYGGAANDVIYGGDDSDSGAPITAGPTAKSESASPGLFGGAGDDYLDGGRGNDLLVGGLGFDTQVGGPGNDVFKFSSAAESPKGSLRDLILDFKKGDRIDLSDIGSGFDFIGKKGFHDEAGEIRFKKSIVQLDTDGNGKADLEIKLDGVTKLKDGDFIL